MSALAPLTKLSRIAIAHEAQVCAHHGLDEAISIGRIEADAGKSLGQNWSSVIATADLLMRQVPTSDLDAAILVGMAASWMSTLIDNIKDRSNLPIDGVEQAVARVALRLIDQCADRAGETADLLVSLRREAATCIRGEVA